MNEFEFFETKTLQSHSDKFELTRFINDDFDSWIDFYKFDTPKGYKTWDNLNFTYEAHRILKNFVIDNKIVADDIETFNQISEDVRKEDLSELYYFLSRANELGYFDKFNNRLHN